CAAREVEEEVGVKLDPSTLTHVGRWVTPSFVPRRFDTHFFLAKCPEGQEPRVARSEEHTSELQSRFDLVCRLLLEKKKQTLTFSGDGRRLASASEDNTGTVLDVTPDRRVEIPEHLASLDDQYDRFDVLALMLFYFV